MVIANKSQKGLVKLHCCVQLCNSVPIELFINMASSSPTEIAGASCPGENTTDSNATETTPLVKKSKVKRSDLLRTSRLRESVLIKSKAANMILFWSTLAYLVYGSTLNPENCFMLTVRLFLGVCAQLSDVSISLGRAISAITFMNMIGSGIYGLIGIWLLFYPLAGYLADVRYGRYKVVTFGLITIWLGILTFAILFLIWCGVVLKVSLNADELAIQWCIYSMIGLILVTYLILSVGFAAFAANVIQFGIDQLQDLPAKSSFLFIHWYLLVLYGRFIVGKLIWSTWLMLIPLWKFRVFLGVGLILLVIVFLVLIIGMPISFCVAKRKWFIIDSGIGNPYREVVRVVGFARRHKVPIQRSAFTYWEDDIPTGLDLGKNKYGGPFTTEQVENVKAFFGIINIFIALGPIFTADIAASAFLPILKSHMDYLTFQYDVQSFTHNLEYIASNMSFYPVFMVILIPAFLKIIYPLFQRYVPTILKRIGIGLCFITVSLLCSLLVDTIGHALPSGQNATSVFAFNMEFYLDGNYSIFVGVSSLHLSPYILIIQNFLIAVAYMLIYGGVFEFICAQSPHSMKGVLIGIFFAVKGLFHLIGVLGILLPFSFWQTSPRAGLVYFLVNIVISIVGVVAFTIAAKRYKYRERDDFCDIRKYIEEVFEKDVQHNREFEDLSIKYCVNNSDANN